MIGNVGNWHYDCAIRGVILGEEEDDPIPRLLKHPKPYGLGSRVV
jgi:hypothetical protein